MVLDSNWSSSLGSETQRQGCSRYRWRRRHRPGHRGSISGRREEGARVVSWDITGDPNVDVSSSEDVDRAADQVARDHGRIDILINNAGIVRDAQLIKWKDGEIV